MRPTLPLPRGALAAAPTAATPTAAAVPSAATPTAAVPRAAAPSAAMLSGARHGLVAAPVTAPPLPEPAQGVIWSAGRMPHGQSRAQPQGQPYSQLAAPPPRAKSADAPVACRAAAPVAYAQTGVVGVVGVGAGARVSRAPPVPVHVHPQAEHPPRQPLPATHPAPPNPPPAAVVGDARLQRQGVARAAFGAEPTPRNADAPEGLQKRLRSPEPASGPIATGSPPAATRCRSG